MKPEEECTFICLLPDGSLLMELSGTERSMKIHGVDIPKPPSEVYVDMMTNRIHKLRKALRCRQQPADADGQIRASISYYGWQDKSGEVWLDLGRTLLEEGLARVSAGSFPERAEYLRYEQKARSQGKGLWAEMSGL
jgi:hypothetical protein